jgi:hypothetical protein
MTANQTVGPEGKYEIRPWGESWKQRCVEWSMDVISAGRGDGGKLGGQKGINSSEGKSKPSILGGTVRKGTVS